MFGSLFMDRELKNSEKTSAVKMKCPYAVQRKVITISAHIYNDEGVHTGTSETINNYAIFMDCVKEKCGAWRNGRCHYNDNKS